MGSAARAQAPEPSAVELGGKARRAQDLGRFDEAIDAYAKAYQVSGDAGYLYSLAEVHRGAGHLDDALRMYQTYVRRDPNGSNRATAEKHIKDLEKQIARAKKAGQPAPVGLLFPPPPPPPAKVVAPAPAPAAQVAVPAPPPAAQVAAPAPPPVAQVAAPAPPPPAAAPVMALPPPPAPLAPAATQPPPVAPTAPPPLVAEPTPVPGADLTAPGTLPAPEPAGPPLPRWVPWVLTGATVGLGVAAIVSGVSASSRYDELHDSCGKSAGGCASADIDDVKSRARRTNILWALTSAAAVGAGVTIYMNVDAAGTAGLWRF